MPVTPHGRQQRKSGGVATKPEARRIAANIVKLRCCASRDDFTHPNVRLAAMRRKP